MAELQDDFCPYAPGASVMKAIDHHRDHGLADPVNNLVLERISVPESMIPRTRQALQFLGLTDEEGKHLEAFDRLRRATTEEFPGLLAEIVQSAYQPVLVSVDITTADDTRLNDAFRGFEPQAQRGKMVSLFKALCQRAGLMEGPRRRGPSRPRTEAKAQTAKVKRNGAQPPAESPPTPPPTYTHPPARRDYRLIASVFERLPDAGHWTAARRKSWLELVTAAVDDLIDVREPDQLRDAIWRAADADVPVRVGESLGVGPDGRDYVRVEGSDTGVPADEIVEQTANGNGSA